MLKKLIEKIYRSPPVVFVRRGIAGKIDRRLDPVVAQVGQVRQAQERIVKDIERLDTALRRMHAELDDRLVRSIQIGQLSQWWIKQIMERQEFLSGINGMFPLADDFSAVLQRLFREEGGIEPPSDVLLLMELVQLYLYEGGVWKLRQEINDLARPSSGPCQDQEKKPPLEAERLKILVVSGMFPAIEHGGGLRLFDILTHVGSRHEVDLYSAYDEGLDAYSRELLAPALGEIRLVDNGVFADGKRAQDDIRAWLASQGKDKMYYDVVQLEYPHAIALIPAMRRYGRRIGFTFMECLSKSYVIKIREMIASNRLEGMSPIARNFWKYTVAEKFAMDNADFRVAVTPEDAAFLGKLSAAPVEVVPTCVSQREIIDKVDACGVAPRRGTVVFLGYFGHYPNVDSVRWYLAHVHPSVKNRVPGYRFLVVGAGDTSEVRRIAEGDDTVSFTGRVDDVIPCIKEAEVCVLPLITGAGIRGKLNQYSMAGRPSVSTTIGNKGLGYEHGRSILIADDPMAFAEAVITLLSDRELNQRIANAAREHAREYFTWPRHIEHLERIYRGGGE